MTTAVRGRFITVEGGDGAGKSTLIRAIADRVRAAGLEVTVTREPGGTELGHELRAIVLEPRVEQLSPVTELALLMADRLHHVQWVIRPALARGEVVICDRFMDSTYAYQGGGRGVPEGAIAGMESLLEGLTPDLTLLLDLPVAVSRARVAAAGQLDRIEREGDDFAQRVREGFLKRAAQHADRFRVIDAALPPQRVIEDAELALEELLSGRMGH